MKLNKPLPKNVKSVNEHFTKNNFSIMSEDTRIYVFEISDGSVLIVKIGQSKNIRSRVAKIKRDTGLTVKKIYFTPYMSRDNARLVEWACQEMFSSRCVRGEFFSVDFAEACAVVDSFVKLVSVPAIVSNVERSEKLLAIVNEIKTLSGNKTEERAILINSAKLIVGN